MMNLRSWRARKHGRSLENVVVYLSPVDTVIVDSVGKSKLLSSLEKTKNPF